MIARDIAVWTLRCTAVGSFAPKARATATLPPTLRPINTLTIRLIRLPVEPTAARHSLPAKRPTTTMSAALKSSCNMPEAIRENISTFGSSGPSVMSIS